MPAQRREDAAHEDVEHGLHERGVVGKPVAQREGQREHPLAHGGGGQHAIDEVRGGVGHAAAAARGTEAAALAREGDDAVEAAAVAAHADEAVGKDPAAQGAAELARDEAGPRPPVRIPRVISHSRGVARPRHFLASSVVRAGIVLAPVPPILADPCLCASRRCPPDVDS